MEGEDATTLGIQDEEKAPEVNVPRDG